MQSTDNIILHIGVGSFHRAHQAAYLHQLRETGDCAWAIVAGNIRNDTPELIGALATQRGEFTLETVTPFGERRYERIRSIIEVIPFEGTLARLIEVGADSKTRIVSFTVTEAGYYFDASGKLDVSNPDLRSDLENNTRLTIYGAIAAILRERMKRDGAPVTLLSCDNLRNNGARFCAGLLAFLEHRGEATLLSWAMTHAACPGSMVDRITPRPPQDLPKRVASATGWADRAPVTSEGFTQWAIEDNFAAGRPEWERVGVELVSSVHAYEDAKIRILNATHGCLAWAGTLAGLTHIHEDVGVPAIRKLAFDYITDDVIPCLQSADHASPLDLARYRDAVLDRFANPYLPDTNERVAANGFTKVSEFILPTIRERLARGESIRAVARLPVLLLAVLQRWYEGSLPFLYQDQLMPAEKGRAICAASNPLGAFVGERILWQELTGDHRLYRALEAAQEELRLRSNPAQFGTAREFKIPTPKLQ